MRSSGLSTPHSTNSNNGSDVANRSRNGSPLRPAFTPVGSHYAMKTDQPDYQGVEDHLHPVISAGRVAVITGGASGIGRAAGIQFAKLGLKVALADVDEKNLEAAGKEIAAIVGESNTLIVPTDVADLKQVERLRDRVYEHWGEVAVVLNNAAIGLKGTSWEGIENWHKVFNVNLFGVINVQQVFVKSMLHQENQAMIINTGSKQGITNPPGNAAYNASKAAIKSLTEGLAHELRERPHSNVTAHLFIPGWTYTGMTGAKNGPDAKPAGAFTAEECVLYMLDKVRMGKFYILVPDNETRKEVDELRIMWGAGDIVEGRPALSRWHKDYKSIFEDWMKEGLADMEH